MPEVLPEEPNWQVGSVGSVHAVLAVHIVVQAAKIALWFEQLKHVVPDAQGFPQSASYVVQTP